ncbi:MULTISPECIES: Imm50 family immunity protein [Pseudomonas]|uniref:Imm50 family immunity protein n=1 Tax=Pseudomonas TaxID=286 RepID=UPI00272D9719|nr:Imm50 family immunity protein [Pseudomonas sp. OVF7]WLD68426.1 Imm50 family immunity protein [Pseudomonas sp. OVF7]
MKYWNELDGSIFFSKIFSLPIKIGKIALFSLRIENDQPCVGLGFDIPEFPDKLPEKWKNKGYNTCRIGITCNEIEDLKIQNIPIHKEFLVTIEKQNNHFKFKATNDSALIEFKAKFISLSDPNVYINGPDDYFFK